MAELNVYYDPDYTGSAFAFETTRKATWVAQSLASDPIAGIRLVAPRHLSWDEVAQVHSTAYVQAIRTGEPRALAQSQSLKWDAGLGPMVLATNGGTVAAALDAMRHGISGSLSSGLHHARRAAGRGYCTFNGLAIAARAALQAGARAVLILDLDAHCGGGTAELIADEPRIWQQDVSVDDFDQYASSDRVRLHMVQDSACYLAQVDACLQTVDAGGVQLDLCLYNAGMDPHEGSADGALAGMTAQILQAREEKVFGWCRKRGLPIAFVLAGGYIGTRLDAGALVGLHRLTLAVAARHAAMETTV
jgi:acetoin utilization deacetylase AcuC-like enzyme